MASNMIKNISVEITKDLCEVDIDQLDDILLKLPAELYIELYVRMTNHIDHKILKKFEWEE